MEGITSYEDLVEWKKSSISNYLESPIQLNLFHDQVFRQVFQLAVREMQEKPPCVFTWFVTGSGGRFEQGLVSDQDHGIVYGDSRADAQEYFLELGKKISDGLALVGYPYCEGKVMSSNVLWCQNRANWRVQLLNWMEESSWSSIRNLQIFYDARAIEGDTSLLTMLKDDIHQYCQLHPQIFGRFYENIRHVKAIIGPLGQLLVEEKGTHVGAVDLKYGAFIPYVNAVRLLALKEGVIETSTLNRLAALDELVCHKGELTTFSNHFAKLLELRQKNVRIDSSYDDSHYLYVKKLSKSEQKELKQILRDTKKLQQIVHKQIESSGSYGV